MISAEQTILSPITTKEIKHVAEPPAWLLSHPDANVQSCGDRVEFVSLAVCEDCRNSARMCQCIFSATTESIIYDRNVGLNQSLIDELRANALKVSASAKAEAAAAEAGVAAIPALPFFQSIALPLAAKGLKVIPVNGKVAFLPAHQKEATSDVQKITEVWKQHSKCNVAVMCIQEQGGTVILDDDGKVNLMALYTAETGNPAPITYRVVSTPPKNSEDLVRSHIYFQQTPETIALTKNITEDLTGGEFSLRVKNFYVVGEGSIHPDHGGTYKAICNAPIVPMPAEFLKWLLGRVKKETPKPAGDDGTIREPGRHMALVRFAGMMRAAGMKPDAIEEQLGIINEERCLPALPDKEIVQIAASVGKYPIGTKAPSVTFGNQPTATEPGSNSPANADALELECYSDIGPTLQEWLWEGHVPVGALALYAGNPDVGKSLAAIDLIACVTTGRDFPDGTTNIFPPSACLLAEAEDDSQKTIAPRLRAAGADVNKVHKLHIVKPKGNGQKRMLQLSRDMETIEKTISEKADLGIRLVVISPITAYLGDGVKSIDDAAIRAILGPLQEMAGRLDISIVCIMHLNKSSDYDVIYRLSGAMGYVAVARSVWVFTRDGREEKQSNKRLMLPVKGNLAEQQKGLVYHVKASDEPVAVHDRRANCMVNAYPPVIVWGETTDVSANEVMKSTVTSKSADQLPGAKIWVNELFKAHSGGPVSYKDFRQALRGSGLNDNVIKRAKHALGIVYDSKTQEYSILPEEVHPEEEMSF